MAKIKIVGDGTPKGTRVEVDGELLQGVQCLKFTVGVHEKPRVVLEIKAPEIDMDLDTQLGAVLCMAHKEVQHRDGRGPWCDNCGTGEGRQPGDV